MTTVSSLVKTLQKEHGKGIGGFDHEMVDIERVPTGLFQVDLALGGGFPRGKTTTIFGPESSGKTNIALCSIAQNQKMNPKQANAFIDLENSFDFIWAQKLGVDTDKLLVIRPDYAEQAVDIIDALMGTTDLGLLVVDSIAGFVTKNEQESSSEKAIVGGAALLVGKMIRKINSNQLRAAKEHRYPTVIVINQTRHKVGVMYGNPETEPGGNALKFFSNMRLRVSGKNIMDSKISKSKPVFKEISIKVIKWKVPILRQEVVVTQSMVNHGNYKIGQSNDWNTISNYLKDYGLLTKEKNGWKMLDKEYKLLDDCKNYYETDFDFQITIRQGLIDKILGEELSTSLIQAAGEVADTDDDEEPLLGETE